MIWQQLVRRVRRSEGGWGRDLILSDELRARLTSVLLWVLVGVAAMGGATSWLREGDGPYLADDDVGADVGGDEWAAAGFGARFVAAYLAAGAADGAELEVFLGFAPDLPPTPGPVGASDRVEVVEVVEVVDVRRVSDAYWAVTVVAGSPGAEQFWRVGVVSDGARLVAAALPSPVAAPAPAARVELAVAAEWPVAGDDPIVQAVAGFVGAYLCGEGDLGRYLAPGAVVDPVQPPACVTARLERWGARPSDERHQLVVADVVLDEGPSARRVSVAVVLAQRDGRWEVAELLPAPPLATPVAEQGVVP